MIDVPSNQASRRLPVEELELGAVEAYQAAPGAEPEIAVGRLCDAEYPAIRQALLRLPGLQTILGHRLQRIKRLGRRGSDQPQEDDGSNAEQRWTAGHGLLPPSLAFLVFLLFLLRGCLPARVAAGAISIVQNTGGGIQLVESSLQA